MDMGRRLGSLILISKTYSTLTTVIPDSVIRHTVLCNKTSKYCIPGQVVSPILPEDAAECSLSLSPGSMHACITACYRNLLFSRYLAIGHLKIKV